MKGVIDFFRHDVNAQQDLKIRRVIRDYGYEGYGVYWHIVEILYMNGGKASYEDLRAEVTGVAPVEILDSLIESGLLHYLKEDDSVVKTGQVHKEAVRWQLSLYKRAFLYEFPNYKPESIKLYVYDAKEAGGKYYEVEEIPAEQIDELLKCEFELGTVYGTTKQIDASLMQKAVLAEQALAALDTEKKKIEADYKKVKAEIQAAMIENGVKTYETDNIRITVKSAYEKTTVDSKKLQDKYPEVYAACAKKSKVSESLTITFKGSL